MNEDSMPVTCDCGATFDLNDGVRSIIYTDKIICADCAEEELCDTEECKECGDREELEYLKDGLCHMCQETIIK